VPPDPTKSRRYAVYFAPAPDSALWRAGSRWLGRDAVTGEPLTQPVADGIDPGRLVDVTEAPCFYGFHATMKPPFHLRDGADEAGLIEAVDAFAAGCTAFQAGPLTVGRLGRFMALVLAGRSPEMERFAAACVRELDGFRAAPSRTDVDRRRTHGLTDRQEAYLQQWGYPYVMEEFRFHMSLTGGFDDEDLRARIETALDALFAAVAAEPLQVDSVCLFRQENRRTPFRLTARFALGRR